MSTLSISLSEWQRLGPDGEAALAGRSFGDDEAVRGLAAELTKVRKIEVLEFARGLEFRATSFVGRIQLGDLCVTIEPKLNGAPFLHLLRYAYGLRNLDLHQHADYATRPQTFQDLLIHQLAAEAEELLRAGLHRDYARRDEKLASPRGRIDFGHLVKTWTPARTTLPCAHHPRSEDHVLNRALLAGLAEAHQLTTDLKLRAHLMRLVQTISQATAMEQLSPSLVTKAQAYIDRRTHAYGSVLTVIELLLRGEGVGLENEADQVSVPGFLFDMNRFFQQLVSRFLHDYLEDYTVEDECRLKDMFAYDSLRNPQRRRPPEQRPDFLVQRDGKVVEILDAKYRDLWETALPRDMLYQLALYALSRSGPHGSAVILYATLNTSARDQAVIIHEPATGAPQAEIGMRPVNLMNLDALLREKGPGAERQKQSLAHEWVFGVGEQERA